MLKSLFALIISTKSTNEDEERREFILNVILCAIIFLLILANASIIFKLLTHGEGFDNKEIIPLGVSLGVLSFFIGILILSKRGFSKASSHILVLSIFIFIIILELSWGIELVATILFSVLLIIISGILINTRFAFISAFFLSIASYIIYSLEINQLIHPNLEWKSDAWDSQDVLILNIIFIIIATISWLSNREIEKSLTRARKSETELKKERDLLEIRVQEKTKEIKEMQLKEITQFHRLAEFGKLSAGLFHELANPLTALNLNIEQMNDNKKNNQAWEIFGDNLEKATKATRKMGGFINSIRKQVAAQEDKVIFSINQEIEEVIEIMTYKARKNLVEIFFEANEDIKINNNPLKLHQIIANLVSNAIDSYGKQIEKELRYVTIKLKKDLANNINISVIDNGEGINPEIKDKIFEPFFSTKDYNHGTGLGLAITKNIVENDFNGKIWIKKENEIGSTFKISIPENI